jgi:hypothetical protein
VVIIGSQKFSSNPYFSEVKNTATILFLSFWFSLVAQQIIGTRHVELDSLYFVDTREKVGMQWHNTSAVTGFRQMHSSVGGKFFHSHKVLVPMKLVFFHTI